MHTTRIKEMHRIDEKEAREVLKEHFPTLPHQYLSYFSWPQLFSNTAGPFSRPGMLVGQAFTTWQMECWTDGRHAFVFSRGREVSVMRCLQLTGI